MTTPRLHSTSI